MRAGRALLALIVVVGATASGPRAAESSTSREARNQPAASTQARPVAQPRQQAARRVTEPARQMAARPVNNRLPPRAAIAPQEQAFAALLTPVVAPAALNLGTPILPVAQTSGLSCVPFARMATGMNISGDARHWWFNAAGTYARGNVPERGAVLAFMASGGMSRGHVGVVSRVVNARTILLDHANWAGPGIRRGQVMRNVTVVDVSDRNDWTSVRVQVGHSAESFGRTYPTHGFIYNRPAGARTLTAAAPAAVPMEVAEALAPHAAQHLRLANELLGR
jgi:surface antigen